MRSYDEILTENPGLKDEGLKLSSSLKVIVKALKNGVSTVGMITALGELGKLALTSFPVFQSVTKEERVVILGEGFDGAMGLEETALLTQMGFLGPKSVEVVGDAIKVAAGNYWLSTMDELPQ